MATPDERTAQHTLVLEHLEELSSVDVDGLARRDELGQLHLAPAVEHIRSLLEFARQLEGRDLSRLPTPVLQRTAQALNAIRTRIKEVEEFSLDQANPSQARANLLQTIENSYDGVLEPLLLPLSYTATQAADLARIESEALQHRDALSNELAKAKQQIDKSLADAKQTLAAIKETAGEAGVAEEANHFARARTQFAETAQRWLYGTIGAAAVTLVVAAVFLATAVFGWFTPETVAESIQYTISKVIVLSVLSFGVLWSAKNYRSMKHNEVLSKHREDALGTFRAFVEGTSDPLIKDAILVQAAQSAFGGRATGFDPQEAEPTGANPFIDIFGRGLPSARDLSDGGS